MGFFKQMKDAKKSIEDAPAMIAQAQALQEQARQYQAAQQGAMAAQGVAPGAVPAVGTPPTAEELAPINGVSLELYAEISKGLAAYNYDQSKAPEVAASKGVSGPDWEAAVAGWNARITANRGVGARFNQLYTGA